VPVKWSTTENIAWKTRIPGDGWSSPIVGGDRVFLTATTAGGAACHVLCLDRKSGEIVWDKEVFQQKPGNMNGENSHASPTPVTDGERVYAVFSDGSFAALTYDGTVAWTNRSHKHKSQHGLGASPLLHDGLLIMPFDGSDGEIGWQKPWDKAVLLGLDAKTGQVRWEGKRGLSRVAHVTPNVWRDAGHVQVITAAGDVIQGLDPANGKLLWTAEAPGEGVVPSVVLGGGMAFAASGSGRTLRAVRLGGQGDVSKSHLAWQQTKAVPFVPSFLYLDQCLYTIDDTGVAQCLAADTGKVLWQERIGGKFRASPIAADGKIYVVSEAGDATVFEAARRYQLVSRNSIGERCKASMAVSGGQIFLRGERQLYCIGTARP
jgi:outer membrane protein assembly factor BamB